MLDISGRDVLLVDDIFDTGHTLKNVVEKLNEFSPNVGQIAVLLARSRAGRKPITSPISRRSIFPMSSSSATGSTTRICIAICRISRRSKTKTSNVTRRWFAKPKFGSNKIAGIQRIPRALRFRPMLRISARSRLLFQVELLRQEHVERSLDDVRGIIGVNLKHLHAPAELGEELPARAAR